MTVVFTGRVIGKGADYQIALGVEQEKATVVGCFFSFIEHQHLLQRLGKVAKVATLRHTDQRAECGVVLLNGVLDVAVDQANNVERGTDGRQFNAAMLAHQQKRIDAENGYDARRHGDQQPALRDRWFR